MEKLRKWLSFHNRCFVPYGSIEIVYGLEEDEVIIYEGEVHNPPELDGLHQKILSLYLDKLGEGTTLSINISTNEEISIELFVDTQYPLHEDLNVFDINTLCTNVREILNL